MNKFILTFSFLCCSFLLLAQKKRATFVDSSFQILSGYYLEFRDTIPEVDKDVTICRVCYYKFYTPILNDSIINIFTKKTSIDFNLISIGEPFGLQVIADERKANIFYKPLIEKFGFSILDKYGMFFNENIPNSIIEGDRRYINIYKGNLMVANTKLNTPNGFNHQLGLTYIYVPDKDNYITYLCSIVYPCLR